MTGLVLRMAVLVVLVVAAGWAVWVGERHRGRRTLGLPPGLTLVTGSGCVLCGPAERALRAAGAVPGLVDVRDLPDGSAVASLPVALVIGSDGTILMRRSGRSVISDAGSIAGQLAAAT